MAVKIVTDSCADLAPEVIRELGITVVPIYVRFGNRAYRDGVDISSDEFYKKLATSSNPAYTSAPSPGDFTKVYESLFYETREIVSIHITLNHSTTLNSALLGKQFIEGENRHIEVMDSRGASVWEGLVVIAAAKAAREGKSLAEVIETARKSIDSLHGIGLLDSLTYINQSGRIGKIAAAAGSMLNLRLLLTLENGKLVPAGFARTRGTGMERLREFLRSSKNVKEMAIGCGTTPSDTEVLVKEAKGLFPDVEPYLSRVGPSLGVHTGPGMMAIAYQET